MSIKLSSGVMRIIEQILPEGDHIIWNGRADERVIKKLKRPYNKKILYYSLIIVTLFIVDLILFYIFGLFKEGTYSDTDMVIFFIIVVISLAIYLCLSILISLQMGKKNKTVGLSDIKDYVLSKQRVIIADYYVTEDNHRTFYAHFIPIKDLLIIEVEPCVIHPKICYSVKFSADNVYRRTNFQLKHNYIPEDGLGKVAKKVKALEFKYIIKNTGLLEKLQEICPEKIVSSF